MRISFFILDFDFSWELKFENGSTLILLTFENGKTLILLITQNRSKQIVSPFGNWEQDQVILVATKDWEWQEAILIRLWELRIGVSTFQRKARIEIKIERIWRVSENWE